MDKGDLFMAVFFLIPIIIIFTIGRSNILKILKRGWIGMSYGVIISRIKDQGFLFATDRDKKLYMYNPTLFWITFGIFCTFLLFVLIVCLGLFFSQFF
jgi:hypothetical protein